MSKRCRWIAIVSWPALQKCPVRSASILGAAGSKMGIGQCESVWKVFGTDKHPVTGHFGVPWSTSFYPYLNPNDACHSAGFSQISVCLLHTVRGMKKFNDSEKFLIARGKPVSQRKADFTCWRQTPRSPTPQEHTQMISNDIIYLSSEDE